VIDQLRKSHPELNDDELSRAGRAALASSHSMADGGEQFAPRSESKAGNGSSTDVEMLPAPPPRRAATRSLASRASAHQVLPAVESQPSASSRRGDDRTAVVAHVSANGGPLEVGTGAPSNPMPQVALPETITPPAENFAKVSRRPRRDFISILDGIEPAAAEAETAGPQRIESGAIVAAAPTMQAAGNVDSNSTEIGDSDESNPAADTPQPFAFSLSGLNVVSIVGLCLGLAGLIGLSLWHRLERRYFLAASR
jgi:hypothetical protein